MKKDILVYILWMTGVTLWWVVCFLMPDFFDNPVDGWVSVVKIGGYLVALGIASFWIIYLIGLNRYVTAVVLPVFALAGAGVSYFRVAFHATITPMIVDATLHTNGGTIMGVVSWPLVLWLLFNALVAAAFIYWRFKQNDLPYAWVQALVVIGLLFGYYHMNARLHMSINQRFPYNIPHSLSEYAKQQQMQQADRESLPYEAVQMPDSIDIVFVLGEAARADHLQLNGYARETTPLLAARSNVISLPHIYSEYSYTTTSVPHILSPADSVHTARSGTHHSFLYTLRENRFASAWISNQDDGRTYTAFIHEADTVIFPNAGKSVFVFDPWYDEQLLPILDSVRAQSAARNIYVLHAIGSHWYYNLHVPEQAQVFTPTTTNRIITSNTDEQIVNSYDNTIRYMDLFVDSVIQRFEDRCALVIYLSDHGEALGEDGQYLHASESEALHQPACFVWYSDKYAAMYPDKIKALVANQDKHYRTDFVFYSLLYAAGIEAEGDNAQVNIFR